MTITCSNSFQCNVEKGELSNTIELQKLEIEYLKSKPQPPQFTDEYIWLETWLKCAPIIDSDKAADWARMAIVEYKKAFPDETTRQRPEVLVNKESP